MAVSSKYTQDLSVQIFLFTFSFKWFLCFYFWPRLLEKWITLSTGQITIQRIGWFVLSTLIHWKAIYPVDSVIQPLNNRALGCNLSHIVDLFAGLHELASASARTSVRKTKSVLSPPGCNVLCLKIILASKGRLFWVSRKPAWITDTSISVKACPGELHQGVT